jgi:DNA primase
MAFDPSSIDVADYLECLEFQNVTRATEKEFRFSCPYPQHDGGDGTPSAYMNIESSAFFCHSCHAKGNGVTLAADVLKCSILEATRMLKARYSAGGIDPDSRSMVEEIRKIIEPKIVIPRENRRIPKELWTQYVVEWHPLYLDYQNGCAPEWAVYMFDRGFTPKTLNVWGFGYSEISRRITLPIRDETGWVVGIKARAIDDRKPKYLNLREGDIEPYLKNDIVFALFEAGLYGHTELIVVEGEYNAIAMHQLGYTNTVAINGSYFGQRQMRLLRQYADSVTLFFDTDNAGNDATKAVTDALRPFMRVKVCPDHDGDPANMHRYSVRRCIEEARPFAEIMLMGS